MSLTFTSQIKSNANITILNIEGSILHKTDSEELTDFIESSIEKGNNNIILNLEKLDYMNSTGINVLISYLTKLRNSGGELIITNVSKKSGAAFINNKTVIGIYCRSFNRKRIRKIITNTRVIHSYILLQ